MSNMNDFIIEDHKLVKYCGSDKDIIIPAEVSEIGDSAFKENSSIKSIDLSGVTRIGKCAFRNCENLESVMMDNTLEIGDIAFEGCRLLNNVSLKAIKTIGDAAFYSCSNLKAIELSETLEQAGESAFGGTAIESIDIHSLVEIPEMMFYSCEMLESVDISGARLIGRDAFLACKALKNINFGSVEEIGERAFGGCESLILSTFPKSVKVIGASAYSNAPAGFIVPKNVDSIGDMCLGGCFEYGGKNKEITIYKSSLYEFRRYFGIGTDRYGRDYRTMKTPIAMEITILDNTDNSQMGYIPLFLDDNLDTAEVMLRAFNPDNTFDYSKLDKEIWHNRLKDKNNKLRIATRRLKNPYDLDEKIKDVYAKYVSRYLKEVAREAIRECDVKMLIALYENEILNKSNIKEYLDFSINISATECTAFLLECKNKASAKEKKKTNTNDDAIEFKGKKFVSTGLSGKDEKWVVNTVESRGGEYKLKFVVSLDYLIYNPFYEYETSKLKKAREQVEKGKPVRILTVDEFKKLVNKQPKN